LFLQLWDLDSVSFKMKLTIFFNFSNLLFFFCKYQFPQLWGLGLVSFVIKLTNFLFFNFSNYSLFFYRCQFFQFWSLDSVSFVMKQEAIFYEGAIHGGYLYLLILYALYLDDNGAKVMMKNIKRQN
jgi:hypothetical protein